MARNVLSFSLFYSKIKILKIEVNCIMENRELLLEKIKNYLLEDKDVVAIVLFGSYARKDEKVDSDIDIAIKLNRELSKKDKFKLQLELEELVNKDIDLLNLDELDDGVRYEILINSETLYVKDELEFELYKLRMYKSYLELNESREKIIENLKNGEGIYGK